MYINFNFLASSVNKIDSIFNIELKKNFSICNFSQLHNNKYKKWDIHKNIISKINNFKINGSIIYYDSNFKNMFFKFHLEYINHNNFKFKLYTFFGFKIAEFIVSPEKAIFKKYGKIIYLEDDAQIIFNKNFKNYISLKDLNLLLLGLPGNNKDFSISSDGLLLSIKYNKDINYIINYNLYHKDIYPYLPKEIFFNRDNLKINLRINNWIINNK